MEPTCLACGTDCEPVLEERVEEYAVRDEKIRVLARVRVCATCGTDLPDDELDEQTLASAFAEYRRLHGLSTPEEMKSLRAQYGLGVRPFSLLLGWGELTLFRYETGSIQDDAHESQLRLAYKPENIRTLAEINGHKLTPRQLETLQGHLASIAGAGPAEPLVATERFSPRDTLDEYGGFVPLHLGKLREMMMYFCGLEEVYPTKLNKLLFYADFLHFKNHGVSITGSPYLAFQRGPVPQHYEWIRADLVEAGELDSEWIDWGNGVGGERLCPARAVDLSVFGPTELQTMQSVAERLGAESGKYLQDLSHSEKAYSETPLKSMISYGWALELAF
jgi:putative zinc finger/helix-turn-helix YgiT family protein